MVQLQASVAEAERIESAICAKAMDESKALYPSVVRKLAGGSYLEERVARREAAVRQWWSILSADVQCHDPGIIAAAEAPAGAETEYALEILDASLCEESEYDSETVLLSEELQGLVGRCRGPLLVAIDRGSCLELYQSPPTIWPVSH